MKEQKPYGIFDYSELPIVKIEITGENATDENFSTYLKEMASVPNKAERYITILDGRKASYLAAKYRIMQGKYIENNKERTEKQSIAAIFIAPSFLQKTILKAIFLVKPYPSPVFIVNNNEEALIKTTQLLEEEKRNQDNK